MPAYNAELAYAEKREAMGGDSRSTRNTPYNALTHAEIMRGSVSERERPHAVNATSGHSSMATAAARSRDSQAGLERMKESVGGSVGEPHARHLCTISRSITGSR